MINYWKISYSLHKFIKILLPSSPSSPRIIVKMKMRMKCYVYLRSKALLVQLGKDTLNSKKMRWLNTRHSNFHIKLTNCQHNYLQYVSEKHLLDSRFILFIPLNQQEPARFIFSSLSFTKHWLKFVKPFEYLWSEETTSVSKFYSNHETITNAKPHS